MSVPHVTTITVRPTPPPEPWYVSAFRKLLQDTNVPSSTAPPTVPPVPPLSLTGSLPSTYNDRIDKSER